MTKSAELEEPDTNRDLRYISNPDLWISMFCPLKRWVGSEMQVCYMIGEGPIVHHGNMWTADPNDRVEIFESYDAIIKAGWRVDQSRNSNESTRLT